MGLSTKRREEYDQKLHIDQFPQPTRPKASFSPRTLQFSDNSKNYSEDEEEGSESKIEDILKSAWEIYERIPKSIRSQLHLDGAFDRLFAREHDWNKHEFEGEEHEGMTRGLIEELLQKLQHKVGNIHDDDNHEDLGNCRQFVNGEDERSCSRTRGINGSELDELSRMLERIKIRTVDVGSGIVAEEQDHKK